MIENIRSMNGVTICYYQGKLLVHSQASRSVAPSPIMRFTLADTLSRNNKLILDLAPFLPGASCAEAPPSLLPSAGRRAAAQ